MSDDVEKKLLELENLNQKFLDLWKEMLDGQDFFHMDFYVNSVINRSLSLLSGFCLLLRNKNFICAAHLVRIHLDNLLRLSAAWLVSEPHQFAKSIMDGKQINHLKDQKGNSLTDTFLVKNLKKDFPWIERVYLETSGFVHLSSKHIYSATRIKPNTDRTIELFVSKEDRFVEDKSRIEAIEAMIAISKGINHYIYGWVYTKRNPPNKNLIIKRNLTSR
jgi:hypothetical protein